MDEKVNLSIITRDHEEQSDGNIYRYLNIEGFLFLILLYHFYIF